MNFDPSPFQFRAALLVWLQIVGTIALVAVVLGLVLACARNGASGPRLFFRGLMSWLDDLTSLSPRRVFAITSLTVRESMRNRALLVFVLFAILLMFGGWFIADANERAELQVKPTIAFILTTVSWLTLPVVMFLSCWGIPEDIRVRSLHTVVTKPVRRLEIVIGRILGFSGVAVLVLAVMGVVGYFWIIRQVPDSARSQLTCRVPVFGQLYFLTPEGEPTNRGINVGDVWEHRSHIMGNSRARAVWMFEGITPGTVGDELTFESRFEAFRTVKGTVESALQGLEAQYTLVRNPREAAFGTLALGATFRDLADAFRDGQYRNAADELERLNESIATDYRQIPIQDYQGLTIAARTAATTLTAYDESLTPLSDVFNELSKAAGQFVAAEESVRPNAQQDLSAQLLTLAEFLRENSAELQDKLPRLEVPLESFHVSEYHDGDVTTVPRVIRFAADSESLARYLTQHISEWNAEGRLVEGGALKPGLVDDLTEAGLMSVLNAELLVTVLGEELNNGTLAISGNQLEVADGGRWFGFFDDLVRREVLASQDSEGWLIDVDLFDDLTVDGRLRVEVACLNDQMYLGMARPDLFVRLNDRSFLSGYSKAVVNVGLMVLLVITIAVTASCLVKGPVAFLFVVTVFVVGQFFHSFMLRIVTGEEKGAGMIESAALMLQHRNPNSGMNASETTQDVIRFVDQGSIGLLRVTSAIVPDFNTFSRAGAYVENGFDVPLSGAVVPAIALLIGFVIPCILLAGACLKFRELESK